VILRIVTGHLEPGMDQADLADLQDQLARMARGVAGLDSLILGLRPTDADPRPESALVTVWRDAEAMVRATSADEQDRFLGTRLRLALDLHAADHYEIIGRTFAALPPAGAAFLRIVRVLSRPNEEQALMDTLREQQPRLVELGLVASHIGRRVVGRDVEAVSVAVWPDRESILPAMTGGPDAPLFADELAAWADRLRVDTYDGIEVAPRLPAASGPPLFLVDDDLRIVDLTASAAATLGWSAEDLVGVSVRDLSLNDRSVIDAEVAELQATGQAAGEAAWLVPEHGRVYIRVVARRDVPVPGRHAVLVRRVSEPVPTVADLDEALTIAFPSMPIVTSEGR
jgi:PAS domain-containing protein